MKKIILFSFLALLTLLSSCGKKNDDVPTPTPIEIAVVTDAPEPTPQIPNEPVSGSIYIINGSSIELYGIYLSENPTENPGENVIGGSVLGEGEEIEFPFHEIAQKNLIITVEDAEGNLYTADEPFTLQNGLSVELRLIDGVLSIITA